MTPCNIVDFYSRQQLREWFAVNHSQQTELWCHVSKAINTPDNVIAYIDAVEEALCFGWIDTTHKNIDSVDMQKFTPRKKRSPWSELNKQRARRLIELGLMTKAGFDTLPDLSPDAFVVDNDIQKAFDANPTALANFRQFPLLYQRVRIDTIQRDKHKDLQLFRRRLERLIEQSERNKMFGAWNDNGRLAGEY